MSVYWHFVFLSVYMCVRVCACVCVPVHSDYACVRAIWNYIKQSDLFINKYARMWRRFYKTDKIVKQVALY